MNDIIFNKEQNALFVYLLDRELLLPDATLKQYDFHKDNSGYRTTAYVEAKSSGEKSFAIFNLPEKTNSVFLLISDGDPEVLSKVVASLEEYDASTCSLCVGDTVPMKEPYVLAAGWSAALFLPVGVIAQEMPNSKVISGKEFFFNLVVFIDADELKIKTELGLDELLGVFEKKTRGIITFKK